MLNRSVRFAVLAALASLSGCLSGCAQNVGTIDRTQPHKIDVSILNDGKPWWFLQTIVDVPPSTDFTFTGESSFPPDRIVWDVQENWLIAYRNYEFVLGAQAPYQNLMHGTAGGAMYFGTPVAAYPISSHFDVQREYNAQTGEQTNVISENTTDRPWYQRQYIRTDWSNNAFGGFNFLFSAMGTSSSSALLTSPVAYYPDEEDPTNKDRAEIGPGYIGIVNKISYQGEVDAQASAYYGIPIFKCVLFTDMIGVDPNDCGPGEVKVRLSFEKIPDSHDFYPRTYTDKDVNMFGVWQQARSVYDPQRGYLEANLAANQYAVMHHIWVKDHLPPTSTDSTGQPCSPSDIDHPECVLPLNQRTPKPIVYYTSDSWPAIDDPSHKTMWTHQALLAEDFDNDMRGVVAAALRGGPNAVEGWMAAQKIPTPAPSKIAYNPDGTISYKGVVGLDYLAAPPDTRYLDPAHYGYEGIRPNVTYVKADGSVCTSADIAAGSCTVCNPLTQYCMGIGHVPYSVIPRMFMMCHNPIQPRVVTDAKGNVLYDKSDSTNPGSFDFSTPGDPDACDPRPDSQRIAIPLNPQMGDLRYHMLAWVPQPDISSPGGIGEPAMDPVTGEIITSHAYIYARAVENLATYGADLIAVMNGWETAQAYITGDLTKSYVQSQNDGHLPTPIFSGAKLSGLLGSAERPNAARKHIQDIINQVQGHQRDPNGSDWAAQNWTKMTTNHGGDPMLKGLLPGTDEIIKGFAPMYATNGPNAQIPPALTQSLSFGQMVAPPSISQWNAPYKEIRKAFDDRHILGEDEIEPTAIRLAKYYKDKFVAQDPCKGSYPDSNSPDYRTCIWESARQEILGNLWRSYSTHEVGHTFGQYHNFAGSTDALNYFDPYWAIRQQNTLVATPAAGANGTFIAAQVGSVPASTNPIDPNVGQPVVLAPEWMQAPSEQSLEQGLREYQYTSIMDYNAKFNSDFQGLGKYDHACHMYQYADTVEVFDNTLLPNVPPNLDAANHPHQVDDTLLIPFNRHYTMYPWLINDGLSSETPTGKKTPLALGISKMIHARRWVNYNDLMSPQPTDAQAHANGLPNAAALASSLMVPYRFCSDVYNLGEAHCLWFDEGADAYEQANGFIQEYQLNYLFNNFKLGRSNFDVYDNMISYQGHLWQRNFNVLVTIFQQFFNDEFVVRFGNPAYQCPTATGTTEHFQGYQCGLDRLASAIATVDLFTKILQTPTTDTYLWDDTQQTYCPSSYDLCSSDGFTGDPTNRQHPPMAMLPGSNSKYDLSQYSLNEYGHLFLYKPTVIGVFMDKILAIQALSDPDSYIVGQLNSQPLSFLLSMNDLFYRDVEGSIGGLLADDPNWAPKVAYWSANPADPTHPPITLYRNSHALQSVSNPQADLVGPMNPWCPKDSSFCSADPSVQIYSQDPALLQSEGYSISNLDPGPVYFERLYAAYLGAIWLTAPIDNQQFIQSLRIGVKGSTFEAAALTPLSCADGSTCNLGTPVCENGVACTPGSACTDGSTCVPRQYTCGGNVACQGTCLDPKNPSAATCNPAIYAEVTDTQSQNTYYSVKYVPEFADITDNTNTTTPSMYYSTGYQIVKLAAKQIALGTGGVGVGPGAFLDILRGIYYYWNFDPAMNN